MLINAVAGHFSEDLRLGRRPWSVRACEIAGWSRRQAGNTAGPADTRNASGEQLQTSGQFHQNIKTPLTT